MRVVIAADGTRGDIYPMLTLAGAIQRKGHDVVVCAPPDFRESAEQRQLVFHPVGMEVRTYLEAEAAALHGSALAMTRAGERFFLANLVAQMRDLHAAAQGAKLVLAAGTQISAFSVAEAVGAAYRFVLYDPGVMRSAEHPPAMLPYPAMPPWLAQLSWSVLLGFMNLRLRPALNRERAHLGLPPVRELYPRLLGPRPVLAAEELLAPAPSDVKEVQTIGCLHPFEEGPLPEKLENFLAASEKPVYIGFGSMTDPDPAASTRLVLEAVQRAGVPAVISEGWAGLGGTALPENVRVVGLMPHATLFQRVRAVVHHGGAGTTTMAARAGTPQIIVPHVLDQFHWAHRVQRLGLGPPGTPRRGLCAAQLADSIRSVMDNDVLTEHAATLGERLRSAMSRRGDPADVLV